MSSAYTSILLHHKEYEQAHRTKRTVGRRNMGREQLEVRGNVRTASSKVAPRPVRLLRERTTSQIESTVHLPRAEQP